VSYYDPKPGDIGLVKISGVGGQLIRWLQRANGDGFEDYEHAFVVTANHGGRLSIVEAEPGGAVEVDLHYPQDKVRWLVCPDEYRVGVVTVARRQAERKVPYSWLDYAACALHRVHIPAPHLKQYIRSSGHQMCSQLADYCADCAGWHLFDDGRWEGFVTPGVLNVLWYKHYILHNGTAY
jgi:hypothetical protein